MVVSVNVLFHFPPVIENITSVIGTHFGTCYHPNVRVSNPGFDGQFSVSRILILRSKREQPLPD
jgi:hypothetical protein